MQRASRAASPQDLKVRGWRGEAPGAGHSLPTWTSAPPAGVAAGRRRPMSGGRAHPGALAALRQLGGRNGAVARGGAAVTRARRRL